MKKLILFLLPFILWGCQKKFNGVVNPPAAGTVQVKTVGTPSAFNYSIADSILPISITLSSSVDVKEVFCNLVAPDGPQINTDPLQLFDNGDITANSDTVKGDNTYSNRYPLSSSIVTGNIKIQFYVTDNSDNSKLMAVHYVKYTPGIPNEPPVISDLVAPDSAVLGTPDSLFVLTLKVTDPNGLKDISSVYFNSYIPPNGTPSGQNPYLLNDDGTNGDNVAGDGIYSITIVLPSTGVATGQYKWEFFAKDRSGALSNKITHYITIK